MKAFWAGLGMSAGIEPVRRLDFCSKQKGERWLPFYLHLCSCAVLTRNG